MRERKFLDCFARRLRGEQEMPRGRMGLFLAVMGPGLVTAFADNDAGGIATYITAGAHYGYGMLFILLVSTICLAVAQEISARTGVATGKGLFELIRDRYGKSCTVGLMAVLLVANIGTTISEFSGLAVGCAVFSLNARAAVVVAAGLIWFLVVRANYRFVERIFFVLCTAFAAYIVAGFMAEPPWGEVLRATALPEFSGDSGFLLMAMGIVGTTITPWGQFYVQASIVDKGIDKAHYRYVAADVLLGTFFTGVIAFFVIVVTAAALYGTGYRAEDLTGAAQALAPLAGEYARWLFAFGLCGASLLAAIILPLSTAYAVCEALGYPHGINKTYAEARAFFLIYTALLLIGAGAVLLPGISLYHVMMTAQILNGVLLPPVLVFMLLIAGDRQTMGKYCNPRFYQALAWLFTALIILLTLLLLYADLCVVAG